MWSPFRRWNWSKKWQHVCDYNPHSFFFYFILSQSAKDAEIMGGGGGGGGGTQDCHFLAGPGTHMGSFRILYSFPTMISWRGECPRRPVSSPWWFLHQTAHEERRGWASDDVTSGTATHSACELSTDQHYESTGTGTFLALRHEVRKSTREREIHRYLSVLCACCDFSCFQPPFSKDQTCLDPAVLWSPLWFDCLPSLLFDGHLQTEKVACSPYICAWEATLQCLVECIFESGSTLKWFVITCSFFFYMCIEYHI